MVGGLSVRSKFVFAVSIALMASVSACGKKAEGQTVAIVNGEEITAAELNAEIEHASPHGKAPGEKGTEFEVQTEWRTWCECHDFGGGGLTVLAETVTEAA